MGLYYSAATKGFYDDMFHSPGQIPPDAVEITPEEHRQLMADQSAGKIITAGADLKPIAIDKVFTLNETRANKVAQLAAYRFDKETGGITVGGVGIKTDRESQALLNGALKLFDLNPSLQAIDWKGENGWVQVDKATLEAVGLAVGAHVQACFSEEKIHASAIEELATVEEIGAYDFTTGWPE